MKIPLKMCAVGVAGAMLLAASRMIAAQVPAIAIENATHPAPLPQFDDVTKKSGIDFQQSFGEKALSSIQEGTGSGLRLD